MRGRLERWTGSLAWQTSRVLRTGPNVRSCGNRTSGRPRWARSPRWENLFETTSPVAKPASEGTAQRDRLLRNATESRSSKASGVGPTEAELHPPSASHFPSSPESHRADRHPGEIRLLLAFDGALRRPPESDTSSVRARVYRPIQREVNAKKNAPASPRRTARKQTAPALPSGSRYDRRDVRVPRWLPSAVPPPARQRPGDRSSAEPLLEATPRVEPVSLFQQVAKRGGRGGPTTSPSPPACPPRPCAFQPGYAEGRLGGR